MIKKNKNMKKYKFIGFMVTLFMILLSSCDGKLDVTNPNNLTSSDFWNSEDEIAEGVIAIYNRLICDGTYQRTLPVLKDVRGDDVYSKSAWTIYPLTGTFTVNADYDVLYWPWRELYQLIDKANLVFYYAPNISFSSTDYKNRLLGQAYYLRALAYYELVENYQKVPLILSHPTDPSEYYPKTATQDELWAAIEADLKKAQTMLPESYDDVSGADKGQLGRATWGSATGLLGKVYMIQDKYDSASVELKKVIDSGLYKLVSNYGDNFTMNNENNSESIFEIQFTSGGTTENWIGDPTSSWKQASCQDYCYGMTAFGAYEDFHPTKWIYNEFKKERCKDGTLDPRLYWTIVSYEPEYDKYTDGRSNEIFGIYPYSIDKIDSTNNTIYLAKYTYARISGHTLEGDGSRDNSTINYRFMRYSEILLLYAEALNEINGPTSDVYKYIQMVRDRVNLPDLATTQPNLTQQGMRYQIAHERALEFPAEGIRIFDIMRWGWLKDTEKLAELKTHDSEFNTYTTGHEYLPIPQVELDTNPNLSGNSAN
jgi:starch-binding outer membrane protein, SusD/RagB family